VIGDRLSEIDYLSKSWPVRRPAHKIPDVEGGIADDALRIDQEIPGAIRNQTRSTTRF